MKYICKNCGSISHVRTFQDIVRRKKLCESCLNKDIKKLFLDKLGVTSLRREITKNKKEKRYE